MRWFHAGSIGSARNLEALKKRGITHVLNASPIVPRFHKKHFSYLTVHVYDDPEEDIARFFHQATCFIARVRAVVSPNGSSPQLACDSLLHVMIAASSRRQSHIIC